MDTQIVHSRTLDQHHEQEPHHEVGHRHEGEDEEHHEKKSVLKKVKAKAKKIKDTIKKHAHGEHHDEQHDGQHIPDDHDLDEEDNEEEEEEEEIAQDPEIHGVPAYESAAMKSAAHGLADYSAHPPAVHFDRSNATRDTPLASREKHQTKLGGPIESALPKENVITEPPKIGFGSKMALGEGTPSPANTPVSADRGTDGQPENLFTTRLDQRKGTESTNPSRTFVGIEDKPGQTKVNLGSAIGLEEDPNGASGMSGSSVSSNAQSKVAEPPGAGTEEVEVTPMIDSLGKMKIHDDSEDNVKSDVSSNNAGTRSYQLPSAGSHDQFNPEPMTTDASTLSSEGHPHQEPKEKQANQDSYTAKISSATTAIADKAVSAKNVLASKLGYAGKDENRDTAMKSEVSEGGDESHGSTKSGSALDYGKKIASTVTEKLSPVYEKVAGAGTAVMSKVPVTGRSSNTNEEGEVMKQDKGVSVTDYLAEKLRPGEDDKALSEIISDALHMRTKAEPSKKKERPLGKVTESEEVARQLGTGDDITATKEQESYLDSPGTGVIDKLKGAVGSWFGRSQDSQTSKGVEDMLRNTREEVGKEKNPAEERRLEESSN